MPDKLFRRATIGPHGDHRFRSPAAPPAAAGIGGGARETAAFYRSAGFEHVWTQWPGEHDRTSITHDFGVDLGIVIDAYDEE